MPVPRRELPEVGEYVVATVREIFDYGAYVTLDEFSDLRAYLPWSEVASKWVRSIREVVRENQKIVVKVIRVNRARKSVDVSLKKVPDSERRRKMLWWKRYMKASKIVEIVASRFNKDIDEAYREVLWKLEDYYGDPLLGLEELLMRGCSALAEAGVPSDWCDQLMEESKRHVRIKSVKVKAILFVRCLAGDGVDRLREVLLSASEVVDKYSGVKHRIYAIGSPRYALELYGHEYKELERVLSEVVEVMNKRAGELEVEFKYERAER